MVPGLWKFNKLCLLSCFNIGQFMLLSSTNIISLSCYFLFEQLIKLRGSFSCFSIIAFLLAFAPVLFQKSQEIENFWIRRNTDDSFLCSRTLKLVSLNIMHHGSLFLYGWGAFMTSLASTDRSLIVWQDLVFNLLHQVYEFVECDTRLVLFMMSPCRLLVCLQHCTGLVRVSLQACHDGLEIAHINLSGMVFVKQIEDVSKVLNLIFCETSTDHTPFFF